MSELGLNRLKDDRMIGLPPKEKMIIQTNKKE